MYQREGYQLSPYTQFQSQELYGIAVCLNIIFMLGYMIALKEPKTKEKELYCFAKIKQAYPSRKVFRILTGICLIILLYLQTKGENLFFATGNLYEVYRRNLEDIGGVAVYFYIFYFLLFIFLPSVKYKKYIIVVLMFYLVYALSRGARMLMVPPLLIYFFYAFERKFSSKYLIFFSLIGLFLLTAIDRFKNNLPLFDFNRSNHGIIISNQSELLYVGNIICGVIRDEIISLYDRFVLLVGYIGTIILPPTLLNDSFKFPHFIMHLNIENGGGGIIVFAYYSMLGFLGVLGLGILLACMLNRIYTSSKQGIIIRSCLLFSFLMFTRWYSYDPNLIFRLPFYFLLVLLFFRHLVLKYGREKKCINS